ncbi:MAG: nucleotidyl transferase [Thermoprotei archaeon]|nr:MAG: nucleotidyl transferase [Thermoprotei archaeon]
MKAIILAAGRGLRLRPITETRPKALIPILCKPLLQWQLGALERSSNKVDEVIIVVNYLGERIKEFVDRYSTNLRISIVKQEEEKGTGDAVIKAVEDLDYDEEVLIMYGDVFLRDWRSIDKIIAMDGNVIAVTRVKNPENYGVVVADKGLFRGIIEKPKKPVTSTVNAGIYKLRVGDILEHRNVPISPRGEIEFTDIVNEIGKKTRISVFDLGERSWIDIGFPWNIIEANKLALSELRHSINGVVESWVTIKKPVYIGENSLVRSGSYIEGPVYIDDNVEIGPSARIRPYTVICKYARIGFSVEVKESVLMEHVHASHLAYIGDSVICEYVNIGAGTMIANLRFDNKPVKVSIKGAKISSERRKFGTVIGGYAKTGVNVSIMPGVKIGSYAWIAPGAVVYRDVPPGKFYKVEKVEYILEDIHRYI